MRATFSLLPRFVRYRLFSYTWSTELRLSSGFYVRQKGKMIVIQEDRIVLVHAKGICTNRLSDLNDVHAGYRQSRFSCPRRRHRFQSFLHHRICRPTRRLDSCDQPYMSLRGHRGPCMTILSHLINMRLHWLQSLSRLRYRITVHMPSSLL